MKFSERLTKLPPYVFAGTARKIADLRERGIDVINFTMGDPDIPTPEFLQEALIQAATRPQNNRYPDYFGKRELRAAIADWYGERFGVTLDADSEVLALIGSKEGIANVALAFVDPGEAALVPDPAYPVYKYGTLMVDGNVIPLPLCEENGWLPDFQALGSGLSNDVNVLWLNYPNNPTGATANLDFLERAVSWARSHDVIIAYDNPYSEITYDGYVAPSILEVPGAKDVAVEFNSCSKTFSMAGHRIGMAIGSAEVISMLGRIKTNIDSGVFGAVQDVAITALRSGKEWIAPRNDIYRRRRDKLCTALNNAGLTVSVPQAGLYLWGRVPSGLTSGVFAERLLMSTGIAFTSGASYGEQGEGFFRVSLTVPDAEVDKALERLAALDVESLNEVEAVA